MRYMYVAASLVIDRQTDTHTHMENDYRNPLAHVPGGSENVDTGYPMHLDVAIVYVSFIQLGQAHSGA